MSTVVGPPAETMVDLPSSPHTECLPSKPRSMSKNPFAFSSSDVRMNYVERLPGQQAAATWGWRIMFADIAVALTSDSVKFLIRQSRPPGSPRGYVLQRSVRRARHGNLRARARTWECGLVESA